MRRDKDREPGQSDHEGDLDALVEIEADAAEDTQDLEELEEIDEAIEEGWEEFGEEGEEEPEEGEAEELEQEEAEPELTLDHLLRFEDALQGETEEDERRARYAMSGSAHSESTLVRAARKSATAPAQPGWSAVIGAPITTSIWLRRGKA